MILDVAATSAIIVKDLIGAEYFYKLCAFMILDDVANFTCYQLLRKLQSKSPLGSALSVLHWTAIYYIQTLNGYNLELLDW